MADGKGETGATPERASRWGKRARIGHAAITVFLCVWAISVVAAPERWFSGAYAETGEPGEKGPRGDAGPRGEQGPIGPPGPDVDDAFNEIDRVEMHVDDLAISVAELAETIEDASIETSGLSDRIDSMSWDLIDAESEIDSVCSSLQSLVRALDGYVSGYVYC